MPDPVTCHASPSAPSTIECDAMFIAPEQRQSQQVAPEPDPGGARALVETFTERLVVRRMDGNAPQVDAPVAEILRECSSEALAGGLVAAAVLRVHPAVSFVAALKTGIDLVGCVRDTFDEAQKLADLQRGMDDCRAENGTPTGIVDGHVMCETTVTEPVR